MSDDWQSMDTAPKDGTPIQAEIGSYGSDFVIAWTPGFVDSEDNDCSCWAIVEDQEPPACWTDGVCWAVNEDLKPSQQPTKWKPLST